MNNPYAEAYLQMNPTFAQSYYIEHNGQFRSNYTLTSEHQKIICVLIMIALGCYVVGFAIIMIRQVIRDTEQRELDSCDCVKYNGEHCSDKCINDCLEELTDEVFKEINSPVLSAKKQHQQPIDVSVNMDGTYCKENKARIIKECIENSSFISDHSNTENAKKFKSNNNENNCSNIQCTNQKNKINNNLDLIKSTDQSGDFQISLPDKSSDVPCNIAFNSNSISSTSKMHCLNSSDNLSDKLICNSSDDYLILTTKNELNNLSNNSTNDLKTNLTDKTKSIQNDLRNKLSNDLVNSRSTSSSLDNRTNNIKSSSSINDKLDFKRTQIHTNINKNGLNRFELLNKVKSLVFDYPKQKRPIEHL